MIMKKSIHSGHRNRVREKFLSNEFDSFNDHEILEMVLFYAIHMKDTNPLAHELLNEFGSISSVFDADTEQLKKFGLTDRVIEYLHTILKTCQEYLRDKNNDSRKKYKESEIQQKLILYSLEFPHTEFIFSLYDAVNAELYFGNLSYEDAPKLINNINRLAVKYNASTAAICTVKKNGLLYPSKRDIEIASVIVRNMNNIGIKLRDWYIIADTELAAMSERDEFINFFCWEGYNGN